jgi:hypothetical protein
MKKPLPLFGRPKSLPSAPFTVSRDVRFGNQPKDCNRLTLENFEEPRTLQREARHAFNASWRRLQEEHTFLQGVSHPQINSGRIDIVHPHEMADDREAKAYKKIGRELLHLERQAAYNRAIPSIGALTLNTVVLHNVGDERLMLLQPDEDSDDRGVLRLRTQRDKSLDIIEELAAPYADETGFADAASALIAEPPMLDIGIPIARLPATVSDKLCQQLEEQVQGTLDQLVDHSLAGNDPADQAFSAYRVSPTQLLF